MMIYSIRISRKYAIDFSCLHFIRSILDGITFYEFTINADFYRADHNPQFRVLLVIMNFKLFEFEIYNTKHVS
jgi:hypothetical protein